MFGASFSFIDRGAVRVSKALADFNNFYLTIGIQGPGGLRKYPDSDINVASVAMYQEFGTRSINSRPFLRRTMFEKRAEIEESIREAVTRAIDTGRTVRELAKSGAEIAELVRRTIMSRDRCLGWDLVGCHLDREGRRGEQSRDRDRDPPLRGTDLVESNGRPPPLALFAE